MLADFLHKFEAPAFPPVHGRTGCGFEAAATSFIEDGASDEPLVRAERGVYMSGGWVGPVERGFLNTEPRGGMSKRSRDKRTLNGTVVIRFMVKKMDSDRGILG